VVCGGRKSKDNSYRITTFATPPKTAKNPIIGPRLFQVRPGERSATGEYYLHLFAEKQPDLNWDNSESGHEVYDLMKFWLDKGADGFAMERDPFISKDHSFPDFPADYDGNTARI